jgi:hypothetical protein
MEPTAGDEADPVRAARCCGLWPRAHAALVAQAFIDEAEGEVLADLDGDDEPPVDSDMDDDDDDDDDGGADAGGQTVPDQSRHCLRAHTAPARALAALRVAPFARA